ncbi:hypothetical protein CRYUN_Cryun09bG0087100 [Craigia yunnanensis]
MPWISFTLSQKPLNSLLLLPLKLLPKLVFPLTLVFPMMITTLLLRHIDWVEYLFPFTRNCLHAEYFTMQLVGTETGHVPKRYSMDMTKDFVPMSVFSETSQGKLSVEGKIINKFDMRPHDENIENYGKLCRERTNKYMNKSRQIQVIDNDNGTHMRPMPGMIITAVFNEKKKAPTKTSDTKRTRRDRREMEDIMFKLFERQHNWTLRQLIQETDQPEVCFLILFLLNAYMVTFRTLMLLAYLSINAS